MTPPPIKAPFELPQTEMTEAEIIAMAKAHGVDCTMLSSIFEYTRAVERRATLSHPAAQAGAVQAVDAAQIEAAAKIMAECWQCPWDRIHERGRDHMRNYAKAVADVLAATQPSAAPPTEIVANWVAEQWHAEVANRPLVNVHRKRLDDKWRQLLERLHVDHRARLGPTHDELVADAGSKS